MTERLIDDPDLRARVKPARLSPRQEEDLAFLRAHPAAALWHEVGVGKTHPTIARVLDVVRPTVERPGPRGRALVLVKRALFQQWREKILSLVMGYATEHPEWRDVSVGVLTGGLTPDRQWGRSFSSVPDIVLVNYEYVTSIAKIDGHRISGWLADFIPHLGCVVADEAQKLKGFRGYRSKHGIRSKIVNAISTHVPVRLAMSGSPVLNPNSSDVWGIYHFLDNAIFGPSRTAFVQQFFYDISKDYKYEDLRLKPGMASEMSRRMYLIARRITKAECPKGEFPEPRRIPYYVSMSPVLDKLYRELKGSGIAVKDGEKITRLMLLSRLMALQQIASGFIIDNGEPVHIDASHKMEQVLEILDEIGDVPVVVWAHFRHEIEYLSKHIGRKNVIAYGGMGKQLLLNSEMFKRGDVNTIIAHPAAVGVGMDYQRAQHSIRFSRSFTLEDFEQSEGRTNRAFSEFDETIHHEIVTRGTRDEFIYDNLLGKKDLSATITLDDLVAAERNA